MGLFIGKAKACLLVMFVCILIVGCGKDKSDDAVSSKQNTEKPSESLQTSADGEKIEAVYDINSDTISGGGFLFSVDEDKSEAYVTSYDNLEFTNVQIPAYIIYDKKEYPIVAIDDGAFESNQSIEEVSIGKNVKRIGKSAFYCCPTIKKVLLSESVVSIGKEAFAECELLNQIVFSASVESIGEAAFRACENISEIKLPGSVRQVGKDAFMDCTKLSSFTAEKGFTIIGEGMFTNCSSMKNVNLPDSLTEIGDEAFWGCLELSELDLPENVDKIGARAFYSTEITKLVFPDGLSGIKQDMLEGMASVEQILVSKDELDIYEDVFGDYGVEIAEK